MKTNFWGASERHETHGFEDVFIVGLCESCKGKIMRWVKADIFKQRKSARQKNSALSALQTPTQEALFAHFNLPFLSGPNVLKTSPKSKFLADTGTVPLCEVLSSRREIHRGNTKKVQDLWKKKTLAIWLGASGQQ